MFRRRRKNGDKAFLRSLFPPTGAVQEFFAGAAARGHRFADVEAMPAPEKTVDLDDLIFEERVKRELHPLDAYSVLLDHAATNKTPEKEEIFRFKWNGLFSEAQNTV